MRYKKVVKWVDVDEQDISWRPLKSVPHLYFLIIANIIIMAVSKSWTSPLGFTMLTLTTWMLIENFPYKREVSYERVGTKDKVRR